MGNSTALTRQSEIKYSLSNLYALGVIGFGGLAALAVFLGGWFYAVATWGWFLGLAFGWAPAGILAVMAGAIVGFGWPLVVPVAGVIGWNLYVSGTIYF